MEWYAKKELMPIDDALRIGVTELTKTELKELAIKGRAPKIVVRRGNTLYFDLLIARSIKKALNKKKKSKHL